MFVASLVSGYVLLRAGSEAWPTPWRHDGAAAIADPWFRLLWLVVAAGTARAATRDAGRAATSWLARYPLPIAALAGARLHRPDRRGRPGADRRRAWPGLAQCAGHVVRAERRRRRAGAGRRRWRRSSWPWDRRIRRRARRAGPAADALLAADGGVLRGRRRRDVPGMTSVLACLVCAQPLDSLLTGGLHAGVAVMALVAAAMIAAIVRGALRLLRADRAALERRAARGRRLMGGWLSRLAAGAGVVARRRFRCRAVGRARRRARRLRQLAGDLRADPGALSRPPGTRRRRRARRVAARRDRRGGSGRCVAAGRVGAAGVVATGGAGPGRRRRGARGRRAVRLERALSRPRWPLRPHRPRVHHRRRSDRHRSQRRRRQGRLRADQPAGAAPGPARPSCTWPPRT